MNVHDPSLLLPLARRVLSTRGPSPPLPIEPGVYIRKDRVWPVEIKAGDGTHVVW